MAGDGNWAIEAAQHRDAKGVQRQAIAQQLDEAARPCIGEDQIASCRCSADGQITLEHLVADQVAASADAHLLLNSSGNLTLKAGGLISRAIIGERLSTDGTQEAVRAGFLIAQADVSRTTGGDGLSCLRSSRLASALADSGEHFLHGIRFSSATLNQALGQIVSGVSAAKAGDAGDA